MKSFYSTGVAVALGICLASAAHAQHPVYDSPSLLPLPQTGYRRPTAQPSAFRLWQPAAEQPEAPLAEPEAAPMPQQPAQQDHSVMESAPCAENNYQQHHQHAHGQHGACSKCGGYHAPGACSAHSYGDYAGSGSYWSNLAGRWQSMFAGLGGSAYGTYGDNAQRCGWFAGTAGLIMTRDNANPYYFSFENTPATEHIQLLSNRDVEMEWSGGLEARFGHYFNCGQNAWEVVYWGVYPGTQQHTLFGANFAGPLDGIHDWSQISIFDPTVPGNVAANGWVDNADAHRLRRDFEFHNVEFNLLNYAGCTAFGNCGQPKFRYNWGLGVRYFRFTEDLLFSAKENGSGTTFDGSTTQVDYLVDVENNLIGAQIMGDGEYFLTNRLSLTFGGKIGLYGNHINHRSVISSGGNIAFVNNGPLAGSQWNINTSKDDLAMLGELDLGLAYQINCRWTATAGYRALAATGVALTTDQIPSDLRATNDVTIVDSNGSLILHGAYAGLEFNY